MGQHAPVDAARLHDALGWADLAPSPSTHDGRALSRSRWVDEAWPWDVTEGRLRLVGAFGGYFGDEYLALEKLDAFRERYERREPR